MRSIKKMVLIFRIVIVAINLYYVRTLYNLMNQFRELNLQPPIATTTSLFDVYFTRHYVAALSLCRLDCLRVRFTLILRLAELR